ncbi:MULTISPECIES: GNAT family N-acetyltransferase [unclassified Pseudoalteromonas]|uniref:GNAT family N-acetyltransferase n=1 Tax=unclassified Pseudoalteromonas TaxID=194690 RepID=UPI0018913A72|nr:MULTISPECIES: GNAT family N-acetyltransferase [unclassified Pseudoalteromonas]MCG7563609.1 GNAT family N-acetyltransferase [Pseudoalteromonas sp. McH1-42]
MKNKFSLEPCELDQNWDSFIATSPHGTPFVHSQFLALLDVKYHAYYCCKGKEKIAAVLLIVDEHEQRAIGHHDVIHDGIMHRNIAHLNRAQRHSELFAAQEYIAEYLADRYAQVTLKLHPAIQDIRAFLWVNYHNDGPKYAVTPRYTSVLELDEFTAPLSALEHSDNYSNSSVSRRQEIRYGFKKQVTLSESQDFTLFAHYYGLTMARQGIEISPVRLDELAVRIKSLAQQGLLCMYEARTSNQEIGSFATYLLHGDTAYYFYGANHPELRDSHTGTAVLWQAFPLLAQKGVSKLDLEGINSPQRGWFKLSFGGNVEPYFHIRLDKTDV